MKPFFLMLCFLPWYLPLWGNDGAPSDSVPHRMYLIPGQGSDYRVFNHIDFRGYDTVHIAYIIPEKQETMGHYAERLMAQMDTTQPFSLLGVSLGGMIATEITQRSRPQQTIIISSARTRYQLPLRYRFMRVVPINRLFSGKLLKRAGIIVQPLVEPDSRNERALCKSMLNGKDPLLLERGIYMIIHWDNETDNPNIIHYHGTKDHTLPYRRMDHVITIKGGSHMMALTRGKEIVL